MYECVFVCVALPQAWKQLCNDCGCSCAIMPQKLHCKNDDNVPPELNVALRGNSTKYKTAVSVILLNNKETQQCLTVNYTGKI